MGTTRGFGIDIGGSGIKGCVVDLDAGALAGERLRIPTPQPSSPDAVADVVADIVKHFDWDGPIGITLPCVIKKGTALTAANVDKKWIGTNAAAGGSNDRAASRSDRCPFGSSSSAAAAAG